MENIYTPFEESLLLNYLLGRTGEEETRQITGWLYENENHRRYLDGLEKIWLETGKISPAPVAVDVDAAWERMLGRISGEEKTSQIRSLRYVWTAAAVLVVSFGIWFAAKMILEPPKMIELTAAEQVVKDTLPDGTRISLNRNSKLHYPEKFGKKERTVKLLGEAYFDVEHDAKYPFVVEAGKAFVKVLGTSFDIKAYSGSDVLVSVEQGLVMLFTVDPATGDTLSLMLSAGKRGMVPSGSMKPQPLAETQPDRLFWLDRTLEFRQVELSEVFSILTEHFGITIRTDNPDILRCRLSATFRNEPLQTILEVIAISFDLEVKNEGNNWLFYGKGCSK